MSKQEDTLARIRSVAWDQPPTPLDEARLCTMVDQWLAEAALAERAAISHAVNIALMTRTEPGELTATVGVRRLSDALNARRATNEATA